MLILFITLFGLIVGSFVNALVWRIRNDEDIVYSRSKCVSCENILGPSDLIPILSFLFLKGKCRYCKTPIGIRYLLVETIFGIVFFLSSYFCLKYNFLEGDIKLLIIFLFISSVLLILSIYDILYLEICDSVIIPSIFIILLLNIFGKGFTDTISGFYGALLIYTFFYLQIIIPSFSYSLVNKKYNIILEVIISFFTFPLWIFLRIFFSEEYLNKYPIFKTDNQDENIKVWIGGGDLRIAFFMGFVLGLKLSFVGLFMSYIAGSIIGVILLIYGYLTGRKFSEVPFIPFLSIGTLTAFIFGEKIINLYLSVFYIY